MCSPDIGCGPATLKQLLRPNINYYGIDITILQEPASNLIKLISLRLLKFGDKRFDFCPCFGSV